MLKLLGKRGRSNGDLFEKVRRKDSKSFRGRRVLERPKTRRTPCNESFLNVGTAVERQELRCVVIDLVERDKVDLGRGTISCNLPFPLAVSADPTEDTETIATASESAGEVLSSFDISKKEICSHFLISRVGGIVASWEPFAVCTSTCTTVSVLKRLVGMLSPSPRHGASLLTVDIEERLRRCVKASSALVDATGVANSVSPDASVEEGESSGTVASGREIGRS